MKWIDVSVPLTSAQQRWVDDQPFIYEETDTIARGGIANCARMTLSVHFGTHVDAPYHFVEGGMTVDQIPPELLVGPCVVADLTDVERIIEPEHLADKVPPGTRRLLLKTRSGTFVRASEFRKDFVGLSEASARWLVGRGGRLLGVDTLSIAPFAEVVPAHVAYLGAGGVAIETLDLSAVVPGVHTICCLPLKIAGSGGAPARVLVGISEG
jgi:arylformamidase